MVSAKRKPRLVAVETPIRLRIGIGSEEGFTNVDWLTGEDGSVEAIYSAYHFHRLTRSQRYLFMNDAHRLLKPGSQLVMYMPHWSSMRAITDPLAEWPPLCESSFMVYSRAWRLQEQMTDLPLTCDFGASYGYGHTGHPDLGVRNEEFVAHAKEHEINWVLDLHVTLTKERDIAA